MAHIGMVSIPAAGHVNPSLEIVSRLVERGHRVTYANDEAYRSVIEDTGAELAPYRSVLPRANHGAAGDTDQPEAGYDGDAIDHLTKFQDEYEVMLPAAERRFTDDRPEVFLYDIAGIAARILADGWGIPVLQLSPTYVAWQGYEDDMAEFLGTLRTDPRGVAYLDRQAAMLRSHGIIDDPLDYLGRPPACVVLIPEAMQPNIDRVDRSVYRFTGPAVRRADPDAWTPPTDGRRIVLVSLGTTFTKVPEFYRRCIDAFGGLEDWRVVMQIGRELTGRDIVGDAALPDNVDLLPWVPQIEILQHADVFVTHAGMGGSNEGLATGTPMIAAPQDVDQFENADALVAAGVAVRIDSVTVTPEELRTALHRVTGPDVMARSAAIADDIAAGGGADAAVSLVEELLNGR